MNYMSNYEHLISDAQLKIRYKSKDTYYENHHIVPRSLGGSDEPCNLVLLTAREHYIAHHLLYHIYKGTKHAKSMAFAWHCMAVWQHNGKRYTARNYEHCRRVFIQHNSGINSHSADKHIYKFQHKDGTTVANTRIFMRDNYSLSSSNTDTIINGGICKNWRLYNCDTSFLWKIYKLQKGNIVIAGMYPAIMNTTGLSMHAINCLERKDCGISKGWKITHIDNIPHLYNKAKQIKSDVYTEQYTFLNLITKERYTGTTFEFSAHTKIRKVEINALIRDKQNHTNFWILDQINDDTFISLNKKRERLVRIYKFTNKDLSLEFTGSPFEFKNNFNLVSSDVRGLVIGRQKTLKGWQLSAYIGEI